VAPLQLLVALLFPRGVAGHARYLKSVAKLLDTTPRRIVAARIGI